MYCTVHDQGRSNCYDRVQFYTPSSLNTNENTFLSFHVLKLEGV